ncbi:hypothetical protein L226DRAFT_67808 [Lentinus tigrinus ALCF2SS1-7]|uniref:Uncharacterized protein n=1 Tax=Lentinus tigrinus ALCF2SS1-6 TaxID=1328759 RepID=A0A5C2SAJ4_9APHY|nr:hypothetical protein L227DRAFT_108638 [Lentinus tigrinus ALCF2SS1-6]RPD74878.1 hypothetical protein L226DRAFT_67808 [Lentinus tigrinus ALCF2SS1-7]
MLSESPVHDSQRSPSSPHSPWQNGSPSSFKGKKPMHPHPPAGHPQDPQPVAGHSEDGSDLALKRSLLSRMSPAKQPLSARIRSPENVEHTSSLADRIAPVASEEGEITPDEGEASLVASGNLQGTPQARSTPNTAGVRIKTEETIPVIPPPANVGPTARRKRGSRSTIDVFGNPTNSTELPDSEERRSPTRPPKRENTLHGSDTILINDTGQASVNHPLIDAGSSSSVTLVHGSPDRDFPIASKLPALSPSDSFESISSRGIPTTPVATAAPPRVASSILSAPSATSLHPEPYPFPTAVLDQCRNLMIPLIDRNAKLRKPGVDEALVKQRALALLSDDKCAEIIRLAREVRKQMQGGLKRNREESGEPPEPPTKVPRVVSETDAVDATFTGEDREPARKSTPLVPRAADDTVMTVDSESHAPGVLPDPSTAETSVLPEQHAAVQSPPSPRAAISSDTDANPSMDPHPDVLSTDTSTDVEMRQPSAGVSALPPATRTARSRTPSVHAPGPAGEASSSSTTSTTPPESETRLISRTPPPRKASPAIAEVATQPEAAVLPTSTDTSRHDHVTPNINASPEHERVAQLSENIDGHDSMNHRSQAPIQEQPSAPSLVPGLWAAVVGRPSPGIEKIEFYVDDGTANAARCWAQRQESFSLDDRHVAVHLLCLPQVAVTPVVDNLGPDATPAEIVAALWDMKPSWPSQGSLVVQVGPLSQKDPSHPIGRAWLPHDLQSDLGHLDITSCIGPGMNVINLIQLQGMSDYFFAVHATEPSQAQRETVSAETLAWSHLSKWTPQSPRPPMPYQRTLIA